MIESIPPITDPLGKHWKQPDPSGILIDDKHALMSKKDFEEIPDYSRSEPTALYIGKMWRTYHPSHDRWYLHFVGPHVNTEYVTAHARHIIVVT